MNDLKNTPLLKGVFLVPGQAILLIKPAGYFINPARHS